MFYLQTGDIVPGLRIGSIELGMNKENLETVVTDYVVNEITDHYIYEAGDVRIWISKINNTVTQILVYGDFKGKLLGEFGIGSCLADIENRLNAYVKDEMYVYVFDELEGICFELTELDINDDRGADFLWVKENLPIGMISVYFRK